MSSHDDKSKGRQCLTPDAQFHLDMNDNSVGMRVDLPGKWDIDEDDAKRVEDELHDAFEAVIARRWHKVKTARALFDAVLDPLSPLSRNDLPPHLW